MPRPRLHKSTIVAACVAVLLEVPGRVLNGWAGTVRRNDVELVTFFEHGWPWIYLRRSTLQPYDDKIPSERRIKRDPNSRYTLSFDARTDLPMWSVPWLSAENWRFWQRDYYPTELNWWHLLWNTATVAIVSLVVVVAWEYRRGRRPGVFTFGLGELLVVVTIAAVILGSGVYRKREFQRE